MSGDTDVDEPPAAEPAPQPSAGELTAPDPVREELRTRVVLPVLVPVLAIAGVAMLAVNISRVFLAGGKTGALVAVSVITLGILAGAAFLSSRPEMRTSSLTLVTSSVVLLAIGAGLTTLGAAQGHGEGDGGGYQEPAGDPVATIETVAEGNLTFNPSTLTAPAGIIEIKLILGSGNHTLVFTDPEYSGFELAVPGGPDTLKVEVAEGAYDFYCSIGNHREAGMEGTLTVTPPPAGADAPADSTTTTAPAG